MKVLDDEKEDLQFLAEVGKLFCRDFSIAFLIKSSASVIPKLLKSGFKQYITH